MEVAADGNYEVLAEPPASGDDDTVQQREDALRFGWGELVSTSRRGWYRLGGMTVGLPGGTTCVVLIGDGNEIPRLLGPLVAAGFAVLGDRPAPASWEGTTLVAQPCPRPVVMSARRATKAEFAWKPVRVDSDTVAVEVPRLVEPRTVAGLLTLGMRRPLDPVFEIATGHRSFETAASLTLGGIIDPGVAAALAEGRSQASEPSEEDLAEVGQRMAEHVRLASLPSARLMLGRATYDDDLAAALPWLYEVLTP